MITYLGALVAEINPDDVTPGVIGFGFTAIFAAAIIFIGRDLYKRIRRLRYREEIRAEIAQEIAIREATDPDSQDKKF
ncbi:MAG TPA: hypothetical protein VLZ31_01415 [Microbacteriaceae bacterium]|nr:hypothetical protein [Microbacteriaceae bacterium]